jgi:uncharacterized protein with ParB-like and HNH nuclease domain
LQAISVGRKDDMAFQVPITVKEAISKIHSKTYLLPAIQREVVWDTAQIERLFDSLMRDYPIGSFLFWMVKRKQTGKYQFYEFIRDYHERDHRHNPKANASGEEDIVGILDGQQRLTALYVGLRGSFAFKEPRKRWDNPQAFPKRHLYLNLRGASKDESRDLLYDFRFLTTKEVEDAAEDVFWYRVGNVLDLKTEYEVNNYLIEKGLMEDRKTGQFANQTLFKLWTVIHKSQVINYFLEEDEQLDKVLNIFIRVNSGGTILSYSDLLLSIAAAQWTKLDARETITAFVDELNGIGNGFNFNKDWVLKSCLVLGDFTDIAFKVDNFNKANMLRIEKSWDEISKALRNAVLLISAFGYSRETLTSNNAVIPIAYHLLQKGLPNNFDQASKYSTDRKRIQHWLTSSLLKRVFGGQPDSVLRPIRDVLKGKSEEFPLTAIRNKFKGTTKSLTFTKEDIDSLLENRYGQGYAFSVLAILYPTLDFRNTFHIDHIHPRSQFTKTRLAKRGISGDDASFYIENVDLLPNLQLLEGIPNQEKNDSDFDEWLSDTFKGKQARQSFMDRNYIPDEIVLEFDNFREFFDERRQRMFDALSKLLKLEDE